MKFWFFLGWCSVGYGYMVFVLELWRKVFRRGYEEDRLEYMRLLEIFIWM